MFDKIWLRQMKGVQGEIEGGDRGRTRVSYVDNENTIRDAYYRHNEVGESAVRKTGHLKQILGQII